MKLLSYLTVFDKLVIAGIIAVSIILIIMPFRSNFIERDQARKKIIIQSGQQIAARIDVETTYKEEPLVVEVEGPAGLSIIEAHGGRVRLKQAPPADPLKICEKTGWIEQEGPRIICVPNRITIWIKSEESDIDGVSR